MRKILLAGFLAFITTTLTYAQYDSSRTKELNVNLEERLRLKSKKQSSAAWSLLGTGIALNAVALAIQPKDSDGFTSGFEKAAVSAGLILVGTGAMLGSIPLFIASGRNKRKANLLVNANRIEISPALQSSSWQLRTGIAVHF